MIELDGVSKVYRVYRRKADWLKERLLRRRYHEPKWALRDVHLRVEAGEVLGVLGRNGAGKSTLLKLIMGVALPDSGTLRVSGRVTGLLELGTGFNPDLSGRDNIAFNATLLGMTPADVAARRAAIIDFSELGAAIDDPLRTYSSGMVMRLAFAIAIHAEPACFVVDEALSVGDVHFQQKCMRRIRDFKAKGGSIVFVSHDLNAIKVLCDRAVVLEQGEVVAAGDPDTAVNRYNRIIARMDADDTEVGAPLAHPLAPPAAPAPSSDAAPRNGYGNGAAEITGARIQGAESGGAVLTSGEEATIAIDVRSHAPVTDITLGILIRDRFGQDIFGTNTHHLAAPLTLAPGETARFHFAMPINLGPGLYSLTVALHSGTDHLEACYHWCDNLASFEVAGFVGAPFQGVCRLAPSLRVTTQTPAGTAHVSQK